MTVQVSVPTEVVQVIERGPIGPPGAPGQPSFEHQQSSPLAEWIVNHNLGVSRPAVTVHTTGGVEFDAEIVHITPNQLRVRMTVPTAGFARVNP